MRFPHLAHRSAAAHKLYSTPQQDRMKLISGKGETSSRLPALAYSSPEPVQTPGTVASSAFLQKTKPRCSHRSNLVKRRGPRSLHTKCPSLQFPELRHPFRSMA